MLEKTVCVKECPKEDNATVECLPTSQVTSCSSLTVYKTSTLLDGFCLPIKSQTLAKVASVFSGMNFQSTFHSFSANRYVFMLSLVAAFFISYLFSKLLDWFTWLIVIVSVVGVFALGIYISILSWKRYTALSNEPKDDENQENLTENANFYKWVAISLWCLLSILLLVICCLFDRIVLATQIIQAAADFVGDETAITLVPIISTLSCFFYLAAWLFGLAAIFSTGEIYHNNKYPWGKIKYDNIK